MPGGAWSYRERLHDPRYWAIVVLAVTVGFVAARAFGDTGWSAGAGAAVPTLAALLVGLVALPPWADAKHGPWAGAAVIYGGTLLVLACGLLFTL